MRYSLILLLLVGCASAKDLEAPKFNPPISDYRHGDRATINTRGNQYGGLFDGKVVRVIGIKDSIVECEYVHGDHRDILRVSPKDLIRERE